MKWEDIQQEEIKELVKRFYLYQQARDNSAITPTSFPNLHKGVHDLFTETANILVKKGYEVDEAKMPEQDVGQFSFLSAFRLSSAIKHVVLLNSEVIQPPKNLYEMLRVYLEMLPIPWK